MTDEYAVKWLAEISCRNCDFNDDGECMESADGECFDAKRTAILALYKQIPQKANLIDNEYHCPTCGRFLLYGNEKPFVYDGFCGSCGQRIDFAGVKESKL